MSGEVEKCPILHVCPKFDVFTLTVWMFELLHVNRHGDFPCTGGIQLKPDPNDSTLITPYLVSSLQMTLMKACSDTEIFLIASGD